MHAVELRLDPPGGAFSGVDSALADCPGATREAVVNLVWLADGELALLYRLTADDESTIAETLSWHEGVRVSDVPEVEDGRYDAFVTVQRSDLVAALLSIVEEHALLLDRPLPIVDGNVVVTFEDDRAAAIEAFDLVRELVTVAVEWMGTYEPRRRMPLSRLTARQREALETAHELGLYQTPHEASCEELGRAPDCAPGTANALFRRTEAALVDSVLEH